MCIKVYAVNSDIVIYHGNVQSFQVHSVRQFENKLDQNH